MRKRSEKNYKVQKLVSGTNIKKIFLKIFLNFLAIYSLIASPHDNIFTVS